MPVFLFTDIENSTRLWEEYKKAMGNVLSRHDAILQEHIEKYGGKTLKHTGDGIFAVFENGEPLQCVLEIQKQVSGEDWGVIGELRIRMALHTGGAEKRGQDYFGPAVNRTARLLAAGWGGQILLTPEVTHACELPTRATLQDLGAHLLKDLGAPQQIYGLVHPDLALQEFPPLQSLSAHPHNLPPQPTPFFGREKELAEITELLEDPICQLLTLVGPGGIGKTRLALQAAAEKIEAFSYGVYFVPLASLSSANFLIPTIAESLKFSFYSREDPKVQLLNYLREKEMLLILDNFEHLVEGAGLLSDILAHAPQVKILVTSQERLNLQREWVLEIEGLKVPAGKRLNGVEGYSAVELFLQSARRVHPGFSLSEPEKPCVVRICQFVEGMPLGIELASGWVRALSCTEIAAELEDNLDLLATSLRDVPERHRSLQAVLDYSWTLLSEDERQVLRKLSVFRGGYRREAAAKVAEASLLHLSTLVDKSFLRRDASGRYEMLELLRQCTEEKLNKVPQEKKKTQDHHCEYYAEWLHQREEHLKRGKQIETLKEIGEEIENVREGWRWAVEQGKQKAIEKSLESLFLFYEMRSWFQEGEETFEKAAERLAEAAAGKGETEKNILLGKVLARQGRFCERISRYEKARALLQESLAIFRRSPVALKDRFDTRKEMAFSLNQLGNVAHSQGQYTQAKQLYQESLTICRAINDRWGIAAALHNLSYVAYLQGEYPEARQLCQESLTTFKEIGDQRAIAFCLNNLGNVAHALGEYKEAQQLYRETLTTCRELGYQWGVARARNRLGDVARMLGECAKAEQLCQKSLTICREIGYQWGIAYSLNELGNIARERGAYMEAKQLYQESLAICREADNRRGIVVSLKHLGNVAHALGEYQESRAYFHDALKTASEIRATPRVLDILVGMATLLAEEGEKEQAVELLTVACHHSASDKRTRDKAKPLLSELASELSPQAIATAQESGKARKLKEVVAEILGETALR